MALIELQAPPHDSDFTPTKVKDTYLDLRDGSTGHTPSEAELRDLPDKSQHTYLATGVESLKLNIAIPDEQEFDAIDYDTAKSLEANHAFEGATAINQWAIPAGTSIVIRTDTPDVRYFKGYVRRTPHHTSGHPAFKSSETTLEFEELVEGRVIWPLIVVLRDGTLTVLNSKNQSKTLETDDTELLFTLRPEADGGLIQGPGFPFTPAEAFFDHPYPISRVIFEKLPDRGAASDRQRGRPRWIERVAIKANWSKSLVESTYLVVMNKPGRPPRQSASEEYRFTVYLVDKGTSIETWDPKVVVEPQ